MLKKFVLFLLVCALTAGLAGCMNRPTSLHQDPPTDSSEPADPEDGSEPADPEDGSEPADPEDGSEPTDPDGGSEPTDPDGGSEPTDPDGGSEPDIVPTLEGDGTEQNPYRVYDAEKFLEMAEYPAGTYFRQEADIDLSTVDTGEKMQSGLSAPLDLWKPLGTFGNPFSCNYDGNGYQIFGLSIQRFDTRYQSEPFGLFGYAENCELKNITLNDYRLEVRYTAAAGALAGYARNCSIYNCNVIQGEKENFASGSWSYCSLGGLIGFADECLIESCNVQTDLGLYQNGLNLYPEYPMTGMLGGVVGELRRSNLLNCTFRGNAESGVVAGGLVGRCDEALIAGCKSSATVTAASIAGGIVGQLWRSDLLYCEFTGQISYPLNSSIPLPVKGNFGGIAGDAGMYYEFYISQFDMEGGERRSAIDSCRFAGTITAEASEGIHDATQAGGICARAWDCNLTNIEIAGALIRGGVVAALTPDALAIGGPIAQYAVITQTQIDGSEGEGICAAEILSDVYADESLYEATPAITFVDDWYNTSVSLPQYAWLTGNGVPTLLYAGPLPEEIVAPLRDIQIRA